MLLFKVGFPLIVITPKPFTKSSTKLSAPSDIDNSAVAILFVTLTDLFKFLAKTSLKSLPVNKDSTPLQIKAPTVAIDKELATVNSSFVKIFLLLFVSFLTISNFFRFSSASFIVASTCSLNLLLILYSSFTY